MSAPRPVFTALLTGLGLVACGPVARADDARALEGAGPAPAPLIYRSADKSLTFPTPIGAFYCPKPDGWVGSDHGTVVFLTAPKDCDGGGGYASSERGGLDAPNIQIYYGYDVVDEEFKPSPAPCEETGRIVLLGNDRPLCLIRRGDIVEVRAEASYMAEGDGGGIKAEAAFTLVTDAAHLETDLGTFRDLLRQASTCSSTDADGSPDYASSRPACAAEAVWY